MEAVQVMADLGNIIERVNHNQYRGAEKFLVEIPCKLSSYLDLLRLRSFAKSSCTFVDICQQLLSKHVE